MLVCAVTTTPAAITANHVGAKQPATAWEAASGPLAVRAGEAFNLRVRLRNEGGSIWEARGKRHVIVTAMIVDANGSPWPVARIQARLAYPTPPRAATTVSLRVTAPSIPGRYRVLLGRASVEGGKLEMDPTAFGWPFQAE